MKGAIFRRTGSSITTATQPDHRKEPLASIQVGRWRDGVDAALTRERAFMVTSAAVFLAACRDDLVGALHDGTPRDGGP